MSEAEKQRSHGRILDAAALMFRERGIEATSVADIMNAAGMTHGGFYRHFASKEELVSAAFSHAVDSVVSDMERETTSASRRRDRQAYIETYLSPAHVEDFGRGCPLAAMGTELARAGGTPAQAGANATARMADLLRDDPESGTDQGLAAMALLIGTVTLARLADTEKEAERALQAGQTGIGLFQQQWPKGGP
jgi:TetR/AcrR family transcriptional repressor of nem operon